MRSKNGERAPKTGSTSINTSTSTSMSKLVEEQHTTHVTATISATTAAGLTISDKINNVFKCIACNQDFHNPVEMTCGHIGCKRCVLGLSECPLCFEVIRTIGWKNRNDVRDLHQRCKELLNVFELERLEITQAEEGDQSPIFSSGGRRSSKSGSTPSNGIVETTATTELDEEKDTIMIRPDAPAPVDTTVVGSSQENTCETHFDPNSEAYRPYTPLEPYPYATQLMPMRAGESPAKENRVRPSITQKMPLIDTQVFSAWDTQDEGADDKSQIKLLHAEDNVEEPLRLTQSQPLDLTFHGPEVEEEENGVPYAPRRPAFPTSPFLPLDLRVVPEKTSGLKAITAAGEINNNGATQLRILPTLPEVDDAELNKNGLTQLRIPPALPEIDEDVDSQFTSPLTARFVERVAVLEAPNPAPIICAPTPKRSKDELELRNRKLDLTTEFGDEDDRLFLEVEDCVNLVNGNKRRQEEGDEGEGSSDEECFPPSLPEAKRQKIYNSGNNRTNTLDQSVPKTGSKLSTLPPAQAQPVAEVPPIGSADLDLIRAQEDLFASSWTPPENLLETVCPARKFIFCSTRLSTDQLTKLERLCTLCGGEMRKDFSEEVTHLLLNMQKNRISYTLKYLMGIARKKWIVTFDWAEACLQEGRIVPEEPYETSNFKGADPGPKLSRTSTTNLFRDFNFYVPYDLRSSLVSAADCKILVNALGAVVLEDLPLCNKRLLIVGDLNNTTMNYKKLYETRRWLTVSWDWILDCVLAYKLVPFSTESILTPGVDGIVLSQVSVPRPLLAL